MNITSRKGLKATAVLLLFSAIQVGIQIAFAEPNPPAAPVPVPQQIVAKLTTRNNQPISVNGNSAGTGSSIVTGATIETGADQAATINLGELGTIDIAPNTRLILTFDQNGNVKVTLVQGCAIVKAKRKTTGEVETQQGSAGKTDPKRGGILDVCFPPGAAAPIVNQGAAASAGAGAGTGAAAAANPGLLGLGVPGTVAVAAIATTVATVAPSGFQTNPSGAQ